MGLLNRLFGKKDKQEEKKPEVQSSNPSPATSSSRRPDGQATRAEILSRRQLSMQALSNYSKASIVAGLLGLISLIGAACQDHQERQPDPVPNPSTSTSAVAYLPTGWSPRIKFHYRSQGSELIPYTWFLALARKDSDELLIKQLNQFGFLYDNRSMSGADIQKLNPDNLPIGFTRNDDTQIFDNLPQRHWVGLTCAACHTGAVTYRKRGKKQDTTYIIDGAPTLADLGAFLLALADSVAQTDADAGRFDSFADRVLDQNKRLNIDVNETKEQLHEVFHQFAQGFADLANSARPQNPWGPGRVDAFGMIFNKICGLDLHVPANVRQPNAPVSFPFLWNSARQDHVQWHGEVPNRNSISRFARNVGEALGVFVHVKIQLTHHSYPSSLDMTGLYFLEDWVEKLPTPQWPGEIFRALDTKRLQHGKQLYAIWCAGCHHDVPTSRLAYASIKPVPVHGTPSWLAAEAFPGKVPPLDTDPAMTQLVHGINGKLATDGLNGKRTQIWLGTVFGDKAFPSDIIGNAGIGAILNLHLFRDDTAVSPAQAVTTNALATSAPERPSPGVIATVNSIAPTMKIVTNSVDLPSGVQPDSLKSLGYEARPLRGIWATAPYLHNGSVPNLAELLSPETREATFHIGSTRFDPIKVGYVTDASAGPFVFNTHLPGNSNTGHTYGASLSAKDKEDLLEYLKSL